MKKIVIKLGGSILFTENLEFDINKIKQFCEIINTPSKYEISVVVCGGGIVARKYINALRKIQKNEAFCDILGIEISRTNAKLLIGALGRSAYPVIPTTMQDLAKALITNKIVLMGGIQPGQSTTSVALEVAEFSRVNNIVILTDVKGIYNNDPKKDENAKLFESLTPEQLQRIILDQSEERQSSAGEYRIFDLVSLQILKRSNLNITLMSGENLSEFKKFLNGKKDIVGTTIKKMN